MVHHRTAGRHGTVHHGDLPEIAEELIRCQQEELLELSTAGGEVVGRRTGASYHRHTRQRLHAGGDGIKLLQALVQTNSRVAIIDLTGVPTVDTVVAQHLLKTVTAARLMGADCIISGVRPQIAQTIVHLGINLLDVTTKANLASAFAVALQKLGITFVRETKS